MIKLSQLLSFEINLYVVFVRVCFKHSWPGTSPFSQYVNIKYSKFFFHVGLQHEVWSKYLLLLVHVRRSLHELSA